LFCGVCGVQTARSAIRGRGVGGDQA
jgi:hypothetical protein